MVGEISKKILIIDDEAVSRTAITTALIPCGYLCNAEDNPADGIRRLKTGSYDLLLLDIIMNPIDGWETLDLIKRLPEVQDVPVILSSGKKPQADEIIRYGRRVAGFLTKPVINDEYCETVSSFFSWYDTLLSDAIEAFSTGVPRNICHQWITLSRQIKAINRLKEVVSPRCIPNDSQSEEEFLAMQMNQIDQLIGAKRQERNELHRQYPVFTIRA